MQAAPTAHASLQALLAEVVLKPGRVPTPLKQPMGTAISSAITCALASYPALQALVELGRRIASSGTGTQSAVSLLTVLMAVAVEGNPSPEPDLGRRRGGIAISGNAPSLPKRSPCRLDALCDIHLGLDGSRGPTNMRTVYASCERTSDTTVLAIPVAMCITQTVSHMVGLCHGDRYERIIQTLRESEVVGTPTVTPIQKVGSAPL
jgi:hypothetical protein